MLKSGFEKGFELAGIQSSAKGDPLSITSAYAVYMATTTAIF